MSGSIDRLLTTEPLASVLDVFYRGLRYAWWHQERERFRDWYDIDSSFEFVDRGTILTGEGTIRIGKNGHIAGGSRLEAARDTSILIGDHVWIGANVRIHTMNYAVDQDFQRNEEELDLVTADVTIGDGVWIGDNALILEGISIGENAVIGGSAVVTHDVPAETVVAGVPAEPLWDHKSDS